MTDHVASSSASARLGVHPALLVVRAFALVVGLFPARLPHSPTVQAGVIVLFVALTHPVVAAVRRLRPQARTGVRLVCAAAVALAVALPLEVAAADRLRTALGMAAAGPAYWLAVGVLVVVAVSLPRLVVRAIRSTRRFGPRGWRGALLAVLAVSLAATTLSATAPSASASSVTAPAAAAARVDPLERPLEVASPVGAVRAYAASRAGESLTARADRAADDLVGAGGLTRRQVVVMLPTGSGWVDPAAVAGLEERFGADVAEVSMQSTATPSWFAYLFRRDTAERGARALFDAVADRVDALPPGSRPALYVYGESLGATSGRSLFTGDGPSTRRARASVCSVLWVGMPGGHGIPSVPGAAGPRQAMVANPDDPVVDTRLSTAFVPPRGGRPWLPLVSLVQDGADLVAARSVPVGAGHRYGDDQVDALQTCAGRAGYGLKVRPVSRS